MTHTCCLQERKQKKTMKHYYYSCEPLSSIPIEQKPPEKTKLWYKFMFIFSKTRFVFLVFAPFFNVLCVFSNSRGKLEFVTEVFVAETSCFQLQLWQKFDMI